MQKDDLPIFEPVCAQNVDFEIFSTHEDELPT